jgi:hypothetical protein
MYILSKLFVEMEYSGSSWMDRRASAGALSKRDQVPAPGHALAWHAGGRRRAVAAGWLTMHSTVPRRRRRRLLPRFLCACYIAGRFAAFANRHTWQRWLRNFNLLSLLFHTRSCPSLSLQGTPRTRRYQVVDRSERNMRCIWWNRVAISKDKDWSVNYKVKIGVTDTERMQTPSKLLDKCHSGTQPESRPRRMLFQVAFFSQ